MYDLLGLNSTRAGKPRETMHTTGQYAGPSWCACESYGQNSEQFIAHYELFTSAIEANVRMKCTKLGIHTN